MISIEAGPEGFTLSVEGRRVLSHTRRSPCVEIGRSENLVRQSRGSFKLRQRRARSTPLRSFKIVERSDDFAVIDFEGKLSMAARWKEGRLRLSFSRFDSSVNHFRLRLAAWPDERIFGCGERFERLDAKGERVELWVRDRGISRGLGPLRVLANLVSDRGSDRGATPFPVPAFISTRNYWCAVDTSAYTVVDFRRASTVLDSWAVPREVVIGWRESAPEAVADMSLYLGRPPFPPDWSFDGAWIEVRGGIEEMRRRLDAALGAGVKVAAVWARDWCGAAPPGSGAYAMRECSWNRSLYPGLPSEIAALRARGIRFLGCVAPLLDPSGALYAEAAGKGYCVKNAEKKDYMAAALSSPAALLDLTNPAAVAWFKGLMSREMLGIGMSGWLADSGECLPADAVLASGENAAGAHNRWPLLWAKASREAIDAASIDGASAGAPAEAMLLARSGWLGSARYANAFWSGEQLATFSRRDGLPGSVPAALSLGLSGGGFCHSEVGGSLSFAGARRSPECLARWAEMSAFSPILRAGDGQRPESNAQFWSDPALLALLARMSEVYAALKPYHVAVASEMAMGGLPPIRHPWMHYEADPQAQRLSYQYLYGRDLMVAPAFLPRAGSRSGHLTELYLPEDEWVHLWTSRSFRGGRVAIESPQGYPAVFYRAASSFATLFDALRRTTKRT
jgi:alpha-glucosidase